MSSYWNKEGVLPQLTLITTKTFISIWNFSDKSQTPQTMSMNIQEYFAILKLCQWKRCIILQLRKEEKWSVAYIQSSLCQKGLEVFITLDVSDRVVELVWLHGKYVPTAIYYWFKRWRTPLEILIKLKKKQYYPNHANYNIQSFSYLLINPARILL